MKYSDHPKEVYKKTDQTLDQNSIQRSPKENTKSSAELVIIINPIGGEGDVTPEKGKTNRNKSLVKRPILLQVEQVCIRRRK